MELEVTYGLKQKVSCRIWQDFYFTRYKTSDSTSTTLYVMSLGPPGPGGQPHPGRGGHHGHLYPVRGGSGWGGVHGESAGRAGAPGEAGRAGLPRPAMSARGERPAGSGDGD